MKITLSTLEAIYLQNALGYYAREKGFKRCKEVVPDMKRLRLKLQRAEKEQPL